MPNSIARPEYIKYGYMENVPQYDTGTSYEQMKVNSGIKTTQPIQKTYSPSMHDTTQSAYSPSNAGSTTSTNGFTKVQNNGPQKMSWDGKPVNEQNSTGSGFGWGDGVAAIQTAGNLWSAYKSNKLAEESFKFNKNMMEKNYALTKDAYERKVRRSDNLNRAQSGESMKTIRSDQSDYNRETKASRDALDK